MSDSRLEHSSHLPQDGPDALFGLTSLPLPFALLTFETLHRRQKPRRLRLAIDHGDCSFRDGRPGIAAARAVRGRRAGLVVGRTGRCPSAVARSPVTQARPHLILSVA